MPRDSNGKYTLPLPPVLPNTVIESAWGNITTIDIANALTQSLDISGTSLPIANLNMNGRHHINVSNATARDQYLTVSMAQDQAQSRITLTNAGPNNLTGTMLGFPGTLTDYVSGMLVGWFQPAASSGPMTLTITPLTTKPILSNSGDALIDGDLLLGQYCIAYYNNGAFQLITETTSSANDDTQTPAISGWNRPTALEFPDITGVGTTVTVPAGSGIINIPTEGGEVVSSHLTWGAIVVTLTYAATALSTTLMLDETGSVVQYQTAPPPSALRSLIFLGVVNHPRGTITSILTCPAIYGEDNYLMRDAAYLFGNTLASGGKVTGNTGAPLQLDISEGIIFTPGGAAAASTNTTVANYRTFLAATSIQLNPLQAIAGTLGAAVASCATLVTTYENSAGVLTPLPANGAAAIHRLYYLDGTFIWSYAQKSYADIDAAIRNILVDRSTYNYSPKLTTATLICEIIAIKTAASLNVATDAAIIGGSSRNYTFGSGQSIADAPSDGTTYGRNTGAWVNVLGATNPVFINTGTVKGANPVFKANMDPLGVAAKLLFTKGVAPGDLNWFSIEVNEADNKTYFIGYNGAGIEVSRTGLAISTGVWQLPAELTTGGTIVSGGGLNTTLDIIVGGNATILGNESIKIPVGTTAQRPGVPEVGDIRFNSTLVTYEGYDGSAWGAIGGGGAVDDVFYENANTVTIDYTLAAGRNAMSAGPITVATGVTVTITNGSTWTVV